VSYTALVDTHCHVDLYDEPGTIVATAERLRVYCIAVTNTPDAFRSLRELTRGMRYVRAALGIHPQVAAAYRNQLDTLWPIWAETRYVGEVGLDYGSSDVADRAAQRDVFTRILDRCSATGDRVVTVHSRRAADDVVDAFGPAFRGSWILHWYSGGVRALRRAVAYGAYFSVNPAMARSKRSLARLIDVPRERMLTETDGPFVAITEAGLGRQARPMDVQYALRGIARLWGEDADVVRATVYSNFARLLRAGMPRETHNTGDLPGLIGTTGG
jgi:TatD DNase family protein